MERLTLPILMRCSGVRPEDMNDKEAATPHLVLGDFNPTTWGGLLAEWSSEAGFWELGNPGLPTHKGGGTLDRVMFYPGDYAPAALLPPGEEGELEHETQEEEIFFPAAVDPSKALSDHFPVILALPCVFPQPRATGRKMKLDGLTEEDWLTKNAEPWEAWEGTPGRLRGEGGMIEEKIQPQKDYHRLERLMEHVLREQLRPMRPTEHESPMRTFLIKNTMRPRMKHLPDALEARNEPEAERLVAIGGD